MTLLSAVVCLMPLQVVLLRSGHSNVTVFVQYAMILTILLGAWRIRRCSQYISSAFEMTANDARKLMFASMSRVSFWHRTPSAMRLLGYKTAPSEPLLVRPTPDDAPTIG